MSASELMPDRDLPSKTTPRSPSSQTSHHLGMPSTLHSTASTSQDRLPPGFPVVVYSPIIKLDAEADADEDNDFVRTYYWKETTIRDRTISPKAVIAGINANGHTIYIGRAVHLNEELPVEVVPEERRATGVYQNKEVHVSNFKLLCEHKLIWLNSSFNKASPPPIGAVQGGTEANGELLFIGRARVHGSTVVGKVQFSRGGLIVHVDGTRKTLTEYEILVQT